MFRLMAITVLMGWCLVGQSASLKSQAAAPGAKAYIINPEEGAKLSAPFKVQFGLSGMGVAPAGVDSPNTGHHHLLINVDQLPPLNQPIPADEQHRHFGKGQTETVLSLPPGRYTLQILLGDRFHVPHNPPVVSEKITIDVVK